MNADLEILDSEPPPSSTNVTTVTGNKTSNVKLENELNDLQERLNHVERQLKLKTSEANRLKKKVGELE